MFGRHTLRLVAASLLASGLFAQGLQTKATKDDWEEINFEFNSSILSDGYPTLLRLAELLQQHRDYKVQVEGAKATIKGEGQTVETSVKVEDGSAKFPRTSVRYDTADGKYRMEQIQVGGTKTTLVFGNSNSGSKTAQPAVR